MERRTLNYMEEESGDTKGNYIKYFVSRIVYEYVLLNSTYE